MTKQNINEPRTSKIFKSIRRVFNVGKYESLEVVVAFEEAVEWSTIAERQEKSDNISKLLLVDFHKTKETVFGEMGLINKKAVKSNPVKETESESLEDLGLDNLG